MHPPRQDMHITICQRLFVHRSTLEPLISEIETHYVLLPLFDLEGWGQRSNPTPQTDCNEFHTLVLSQLIMHYAGKMCGGGKQHYTHLSDVDNPIDFFGKNQKSL